ncbi:hypothetical protein N1F78_14590 [Seonamhaeicola sp. MEBiC1930]|uniref:hypothetical protein n=1 Tax=Seonamhaeicola sp. MEBiC01930 TaxID=2976768 RepID=UPI00324D5DB3
MKTLILKIILYAFLILIFLEIITRVFHLHQESPQFIINNSNIKTYAPNQSGYYTVGNRRMNISKYHINDSGFNSYREFVPSTDNINLAIIGDSFIEGFHQNYYNSIGIKIENKLNNEVSVFEYGHAGYDLADQLHLIATYKDIFEKMDLIVIYLKFENDLTRNVYEPDQYWIDTQYYAFSKIKKNIKLVGYLESIGWLDNLRNLKHKFKTPNKPNSFVDKENQNLKKVKHQEYINNFKELVKKFGFNKNKTIFLIDVRNTNKIFLNHLLDKNYKYLDFGNAMESSKKPTTLIFDMHWNNKGREVISKTIVDYIVNQGLIQKKD